MAKFEDDMTLRMITYLSPGLPISLFQSIQYYIEERLGRSTYLMMESRASGPLDDRKDPFTTDHVDIAFMCSTAYMKLWQKGNMYMELLPAAPVYNHPLGHGKPVYFSDVIVHKNKREKFKKFLDLKGSEWAYNDSESLSGYYIMLVELARLGYNTSYFGEVTQSGSHHRSVEMVVKGIVDTAAIDCNVLCLYLKEHPEYRDQIHTVCTLGPVPIQPIVINSRMGATTRVELTEALLEMHKSTKWKSELDKYNLWGFKQIEESLYAEEAEINEQVKTLKCGSAYS